MKELTLEELLTELNPAEQEVAMSLYYEDHKTPQEIKEFFDSL